MPPRNPELPEGTDHIINGAMETGAGTGASTGSSGGGGDSSGFIGSGGDDTGGTTLGGASTSISAGDDLGGGGSGGGGSGGGGGGSGGGASSGGGGSGRSGGAFPVKQQLREGVESVRQQAGDRVRSYAETGKDRATTALQDLSQVVGEAANSIDERLGSEYGEYARRAADAVSSLADTLRQKEVDELFDDARQLVRKSPGVAIGAAAVVGFTLVRLIKAGLDDKGSVEFQAEGGRNIGFEADGGGSGGTTSGTGA